MTEEESAMMAELTSPLGAGRMGAMSEGPHLGQGAPAPQGSKYAQLLSVIEEMSRDVRPSYAGNKSSAEKLKRGIIHARVLVRECLVETERSAAARQ